MDEELTERQKQLLEVGAGLGSAGAGVGVGVGADDRMRSRRGRGRGIMSLFRPSKEDTKDPEDLADVGDKVDARGKFFKEFHYRNYDKSRLSEYYQPVNTFSESI